MARVLQKILAVADVDVTPSDRKSKITSYLTNFSDLLNEQDYHGCLRHVTAIINELEPQYVNTSGPSTFVDLLLARSALSFKLGNFDDCFNDAQKALRRDRQSLVAFHLSFLSLRELNELVKALSYLCKCFSLAGGRQKFTSNNAISELQTENNQNEGSRTEGGRLSSHGDTLDIISQANLTDSRNLHMSTLRTELFHFALRTIQHVPDALDTANSTVAPTDLPGVLTGVARQLSAKGQHELGSYCLEAVIVLCKKASSDVQPTLLCALESLANVYAALNLHERALATLARHQTLATEMECWSSVAEASALQAKAHRALGNLQQCEQCLQDRLDSLRTHPQDSRQSRFDLIDTELQVAAVCRSQRRMHVALSHAEVALSLSRQLSDRPSLIKCHLCLGRLRLLLGLYPQSIFHFKTALTVARKASSVASQGWGLLGLAKVYAGLQRYNAVIESCKLLLALPTASASGGVGDAGDALEAASGVAAATADDDDVVRPECRCKALLFLGCAHRHGKKLDTAAAFVEEARLEAELMKDANMLGHVGCAAGIIATATGTYMTAYRHLAAAMELARSTADAVLQMTCHYRLGVVVTLGRLRHQPSAIEHLYAAINTFSDLRENFGSFSPDGSEVVDLPLDCYEYLQELLVARGDLKEAFLVAEFAQQRVYLDMVGVHQDLEDLQPIRSLPLRMPTLSGISRRVSSTGCGVILYSMVHDCLFMWLCLPPRGLAAGVFAFHKWPANAVRYLAPFLRQNYFLLSRLPSNVRDAGRTCEARSCCLVGGEAMMYRSAAAGQLMDSQGDPPPYCPYGSIAQRQQLSYPWIGDDDVIHPGRSSYLSAPAPLDDSSIIGTESRASMRDLYDILAMPFERYLFGYGTLPVKDLAIVAQNGILLCPFSALVTSRRVVVCDFYQFRVQPCLLAPVLHTAKTCEQCIASGGRRSGVVALLCGNPTVPTVKFFGQTWRPLPLPYAEREVRSVGLLLGPAISPVLGVTARRHTLLSMLPQATLIHLAVHLSWELSSFVVAPAAGTASPTEKDVLISASDIVRLHLRADLVILSSGSAYCHSSRAGAGLPQPNQHNLPSHTSIMTLARAFLVAGARCVLVSLWSIPDRATDELMFLFYENIKRGSSVGLALRETMEAVRSRRGFTEPVHWASFIQFGEDVTLDFSSIRGVPLPGSALADASESEPCGDSAADGTSAGDDAGSAAPPVGDRSSATGSAASGVAAAASSVVADGASATLVDVSQDDVSLSSSPACKDGRLVLRRTSASFAHRLVFDSVKCFMESMAAVITKANTADENKTAVQTILEKLLKVIKHSSANLDTIPVGNAAASAGTPVRTTPSLAESGFSEIEALALDIDKVHGLLVSLGFVFNHNSVADDYSLHLSDSLYFSPMHAAVVQYAEAMTGLLMSATSETVQYVFDILPVRPALAPGLIHLLQNPVERVQVTSDSICDVWEHPQCRVLLESIGFHEETVVVNAVAGAAAASKTQQVVACSDDAHQAVWGFLLELLSMLTGDISILLSNVQLDALSESAWVDVSQRLRRDTNASVASNAASCPAPHGSGDIDMPLDLAAATGAEGSAVAVTSPNAVQLPWDSLLDGSSFMESLNSGARIAPSAGVLPSMSSPEIGTGATMPRRYQRPQQQQRGVAISLSDTAILQPTQHSSSSTTTTSAFDVNALLLELGIMLPSASMAASSHDADNDAVSTVSSGARSMASGGATSAAGAISYSSAGDAASAASRTTPSVTLCTSDLLLPLQDAATATTTPLPRPQQQHERHHHAGLGRPLLVDDSCQSLSSASLSGSDMAAGGLMARDSREAVAVAETSSPVSIPAPASSAAVHSAGGSPVPAQRAEFANSHSVSPNTSQDSSSYNNRSWKSLTRMVSFDSPTSESPNSTPQQARCDHCQTKFGLLRWRHVCNFCVRELCRNCFDTDPSTARKDSSATNRDASLCMMCWLATGTTGSL